MRKSTGLCVLIALALVIFGFAYGTYSGFDAERDRVTALLNSENGLMDVLWYRGADGLNLCVVARRHLEASHPDVLALETAARTLQQEDAQLAGQAQADQALEEAVETLSRQLKETASFQQSERDQKYLDMLLADLSRLSSSTAVTAYNRAASAFNQKLSSPVTGAAAALMGIKVCPLFE